MPVVAPAASLTVSLDHTGVFIAQTHPDHHVDPSDDTRLGVGRRSGVAELTETV
jgi:hypothetical protein